MYKDDIFLKKIYNEKIRKDLVAKFGFKSIMEAPKLLKVVINIGFGKNANDKKVVEAVKNDLILIAGQKPIITLAKKAISDFKIRENYQIGCKVTLRKNNMYKFFHRLISVVIPRIRDFHGFSTKSFDGSGNYSFGIKEQIIFPEIEYDKIDTIRGMDISIITSSKSDKEAFELLKCFNFPFKKKN